MPKFYVKADMANAPKTVFSASNEEESLAKYITKHLNAEQFHKGDTIVPVYCVVHISEVGFDSKEKKSYNVKAWLENDAMKLQSKMIVKKK